MFLNKFRKRTDTVKGRGGESVRRVSRDFKSTVTTPEFIASGQSKTTTTTQMFDPQEASRTGLRGQMEDAIGIRAFLIPVQ